MGGLGRIGKSRYREDRGGIRMATGWRTDNFSVSSKGKSLVRERSEVERAGTKTENCDQR